MKKKRPPVFARRGDTTATDYNICGFGWTAIYAGDGETGALPLTAIVLGEQSVLTATRIADAWTFSVDLGNLPDSVGDFVTLVPPGENWRTWIRSGCLNRGSEFIGDAIRGLAQALRHVAVLPPIDAASRSQFAKFESDVV
jgi:hypothetical protein